jgi:hypothetical protein
MLIGLSNETIFSNFYKQSKTNHAKFVLVLLSIKQNLFVVIKFKQNIEHV